MNANALLLVSSLSSKHVTQTTTDKRLLNPTEMFVLGAIELVFLIGSLGLAIAVAAAWQISLFGTLMLAHCIASAFTVVATRVDQRFFPIKPGMYRLTKHRSVWLRYRIRQLLVTSHLWFLGALPPMLRPTLYLLLGMKGIRPHTTFIGHSYDPHWVTLGRDVIIGHDAGLSPHAITLAPEALLVCAPIQIGDGVVVGGRAVLMPGVIIADGATVEAMSFVKAFTRIGPGEVWGGNPARCVRKNKTSENP